MPQRISRRLFLTVAAGAMAAPQIVLGREGTPNVLDHILLGCRDLDHGIDFVEKRIGVRAAFGGVHPGRGTRNALFSLGEKHYLEIIAPDPQQSGAPDRYGLENLTEPRLVGWAAHPGDLDKLATRLRDANIAFEGPLPGSRQRLDGRVLQWKTLNLKDDLGGVLPFFIEWSADTIHPSADAPAGCHVVHFALRGTNEPELTGISKLLGLDVDIERGAKPELHARIAGPNGRVMDVAS